MQTAEHDIPTGGNIFLKAFKKHIEEHPHEDPAHDERWLAFLNKEIERGLPRVQISMQDPGTGVALDLSGFDVDGWVSQQHLLV